MQISRGTKDFAEKFYERAFGFSPQKLKRAAAKLEREAAQREAAQCEREAREAAQREREAREATIVKLHQEFGISVEKLAELFGCEPVYVQNVLQAATNNP